MNTEFINRVELQGIIGSARRYRVGEQEGFQLTIATNRTYEDADGTPVIETQWTVCCGWISDRVNPSLIEKGRKVHLTGRLRTQRYTTASGEDRYTHEVIVDSLSETNKQ